MLKYCNFEACEIFHLNFDLLQDDISPILATGQHLQKVKLLMVQHILIKTSPSKTLKDKPQIHFITRT